MGRGPGSQAWGDLPSLKGLWGWPGDLKGRGGGPPRGKRLSAGSGDGVGCPKATLITAI